MPESQRPSLGASRLILPPTQRARHRNRQWLAKLAGDLWYPHWPLSAALLGLAGYNFLQSFPRIDWTHLAGHLGMVIDFLQVLLSLVLAISAIGMLFRMRTAWLTAILATLAGIAFHFVHRSVAMPVDWLVFDALAFLALVSTGKHFAHKSAFSATLFAAASLALLLTYSTVGALFLGDGYAPKIHHFLAALYFSVVTMSTVGYGDIVPKSEDARIFVISIIILGITVFATSISAVVVPLLNGRMQRLLMGEKRRSYRSHYLIIGDNALAQNTYRALRARHLSALVLVPVLPERQWMATADLMIGDGTDLDVLRRAGAQYALGVLALRANDSENAFIILAAKELGVPGKTVAAVQNGKHLERLRQIGVDLIISPEVLGGELLALALSGENLAGDAIISKLFTAKAEGAET